MASPRTITVAAAQMGGNQLQDSRTQILDRMLKLMDQAAEAGVRLLAYLELDLTTIFATQYMTDPDQIAQYFVPASPSDPYAVLSTPHARPLVEKANKLGIDFYLGFEERWTTTGEGDGKTTTTDYNTTIYYSEPLEDPKAFQQMEKRYFTRMRSHLGDADLQRPAVAGGMEAIRTTGQYSHRVNPKMYMWRTNPHRLNPQGAELVIEGYNTMAWAPQYRGTPVEQQSLADFHHRLSCQAGSYQNGLWGLHVAKCGDENGQRLIGGSMIVDPLGRIVAEARTADRDELVVATIDLALCRRPRDRVFNFEKHRRLEHYGLAGRQVGLEEIPLLGRSI
ncbi:hypothetical protein PG994_003335 [Apiospora phragmitis]|uniref:CN hydrolase domain-containing protein n=1 Tax=Apiospora phragmitis TaxID=2905665 RepID=A0ABR1VXT6_9PEZI